MVRDIDELDSGFIESLNVFSVKEDYKNLYRNRIKSLTFLGQRLNIN
jgi:hypothetical protein